MSEGRTPIDHLQWKAPDVVPAPWIQPLSPDDGVIPEPREVAAAKDLESALQQVVESSSTDVVTLLKAFRRKILSLTDPLKLSDEQKQTLRSHMETKKRELSDLKSGAESRFSAIDNKNDNDDFVKIANIQIQEYSEQLDLIDQALSVVDVTDPKAELLKHPDDLLQMLMETQDQVRKLEQGRVLADSMPYEKPGEKTQLMRPVDPNAPKEDPNHPVLGMPAVGTDPNDIWRREASADHRNSVVIQPVVVAENNPLPSVAPEAPRPLAAASQAPRPEDLKPTERIPAVPAALNTPESQLNHQSPAEQEDIEARRFLGEADAAIKYLSEKLAQGEKVGIIVANAMRAYHRSRKSMGRRTDFGMVTRISGDILIRAHRKDIPEDENHNEQSGNSSHSAHGAENKSENHGGHNEEHPDTSAQAEKPTVRVMSTEEIQQRLQITPELLATITEPEFEVDNARELFEIYANNQTKPKWDDETIHKMAAVITKMNDPQGMKALSTLLSMI